jgi:general secretion pathway protein D
VIVLSGFRKNSNVRERSRLGPIPILGDIFGPRTKNSSRQELVFFIRPYVLTNNAAADNAEIMKRVEQLPTRDMIKGELDSNFKAPQPPSMLDKILPR